MSSGLILLADETYEIGNARGLKKALGHVGAVEKENTRLCGRGVEAEKGRVSHMGDEKDAGLTTIPSGDEEGAHVGYRRRRKDTEEMSEDVEKRAEEEDDDKKMDKSGLETTLGWWSGGGRVEEWLMTSEPLDTDPFSDLYMRRKSEGNAAPQNEVEGPLGKSNGRAGARNGRIAARYETGDFNDRLRNATEGRETMVSGGNEGKAIGRRRGDDGVPRLNTLRREGKEGISGGGKTGERQWSRGKINGGLMVCFGRFAGRSVSRGNGLVRTGKPLDLKLEMQRMLDVAITSGKLRAEKEREGKHAERGEGIDISRMDVTGWTEKERTKRAGTGMEMVEGRESQTLDCRIPIRIEELTAGIDVEVEAPFEESRGRNEGDSPLPTPVLRTGNSVQNCALEQGRRSDNSAKSSDTRDLFIGDAGVFGETGRAELLNGFHSVKSNEAGESPSRNSEIDRKKNSGKSQHTRRRIKNVFESADAQERKERRKIEIESENSPDAASRRKRTLLALENFGKGASLKPSDAKNSTSSSSPKSNGCDGSSNPDVECTTLENLSSRVSELTGSLDHGGMCGNAVGRRKILQILKLREEFLHHYGIREDYFCRHKEWKSVRKLLEATVAADVLKGEGEEEGGQNEEEKRNTSDKDASSSNEAVHLQQRLRSLSTELVTLRNRLHVSQPNGGGANAPAQSHHQGGNTAHHPHGAPQHQPHIGGHHGGVAALGNPHLSPDDPKSRLHLSGGVRSGVGCGPLMGRPAPAMAPATPPGAHPSHLHQGQHCAAPNPGNAPRCAVPSASTADIEDLIHLPGPLTEDAVIRCLHSRFCASQFYTNVGPILVCVNNRRDDGNPLTLSSTRSIALDSKLSRVVTDAVRQQSETGYPQAIILSGSSGSGKTYTSMLVLRQLFEVAGGGPETDAFKHLAAAFTVLRSLGSARTASNPESSRIGHFIEVQVTDGSLYRTKIHCYFLDQTRVVRPLDGSEKNYHIFYQMLAGLTDQEREKLGLQEYGIHNLRYLNRGNTSQDESKDAARFLAWKACLGILGIPFLEVVRVLSAVLLLGNIQFVEGSRSRAIEVIEVCGNNSSTSNNNGASSGWKKRRRRKRRRGKRTSRRHATASDEEGELDEDDVDGEEGEEEGEEGEEGEEEDGKRRNRSVPRSKCGDDEVEGEDGEEEEGEEEDEEEEGSGGRRKSGRKNGGAGSGEELLASVASLLGVAPDALMQGLTTRTRNVRGQLMRTSSDADVCNATRDSLAKALYCRTVATIVRRANSLKRPLGSTSGTLSSDSNDSVHNQAAEVSSQHASTIGTAGSKSSKSMVALNNAVRHATHGFIGILDMFGFEDPKPSQLEHLCINLCAETMQHFYNTHVFKSSIESCRDEGIQCSVQAEYVDNVPCIDLISSLRTGLLSMLDVECSVRGTPESYVQKVRVQHRHNPRLVAEVNMNGGGGRTPQHHINGYQYGQQGQMARQGHLQTPMSSSAATSFAIRHFAGTVVYDAANFLETNRDVVPDDLVSVFHRHHCNFGFATHLFGSELKALSTSSPHIIPGMTPPVPSSHQQGGAILPRGVAFRISPTSHTDLQNGDEPVSTLTQDFHTRLDNLLRTLVHARPHFVRCIRADEDGSTYGTNSTPSGTVPEDFVRQAVRRQIRSLQILETVNLMAGGFPHRMRFKAFNNRYRSLAPSHCLRNTGQRPCVAPTGGDGGTGGQQEGAEMCVLILQCFQQALLIAGSGASQQTQQHITRNQSQQLGKGLSLGMIAAGSGLLPMSNVSTAWATGKRHIFLSEGARQQLEAMRWERLRRAAVTIQSTWRGWHFRRRRWPTLRISLGDVRQRVPSQPGGSSQPPSQPPPPPPPPPQHAQIGGGLTCPSAGKPTTTSGRAGAVGGAGKLTANAASAAAGVGANQGGSLSRPRPQPISGTPPPLEEGGTGGNGGGNAGGNGAGGGALAAGVEKCDHKMIQQTCSLFGLDLERPPPVPPSRSYTVAGNTKLGYPQTRVMKMSFSDDGTVGSSSADGANSTLHKGETVIVIGASPRRGHLLVEHNTCTLHVPYQYLELKASVGGTGPAQAAGVNI